MLHRNRETTDWCGILTLQQRSDFQFCICDHSLAINSRLAHRPFSGPSFLHEIHDIHSILFFLKQSRSLSIDHYPMILLSLPEPDHVFSSGGDPLRRPARCWMHDISGYYRHRIESRCLLPWPPLGLHRHPCQNLHQDLKRAQDEG